MKFFKYIFILGLILAGSVTLFGQSNEMIDSFLAGDTADAGTTVLLLGQSLEALTYETDSSKAMDWAREQEWSTYIEDVSPEDPISLGAFSAVLFESYGIRGKSLMYRLFKSPRYATMEAFDQGYITQNLYHTRSVTPTEVLYALAMAMEASDE